MWRHAFIVGVKCLEMKNSSRKLEHHRQSSPNPESTGPQFVSYSCPSWCSYLPKHIYPSCTLWINNNLGYLYTVCTPYTFITTFFNNLVRRTEQFHSEFGAANSSSSCDSCHSLFKGVIMYETDWTTVPSHSATRILI